MESAKREELASLVYHDIFDYPLSKDELKRWRLGKKAISPPAPRLRRAGKKQPSFAKATEAKAKRSRGKRKIENKQGYFFLKGRAEIVRTRRQRQKFSLSKIEIAKDRSLFISKVPTVKFIGLTGALAMLNAERRSDIDFLVIVEKGTLWTTRLVTLLLVDLFGIPRRRFGDSYQKDKLCPNIWLDESDLSWSRDQRNIYTAHEICQIVPFYNKGKTWERFMSKNSWVKEYWPGALESKKQKARNKRQKSSNPIVAYFFLLLAYFFEPLARTIQFWYMRPKVTREVVTKTRAIFHPTNLSEKILVTFERKLRGS